MYVCLMSVIVFAKEIKLYKNIPIKNLFLFINQQPLTIEGPHTPCYGPELVSI